MPSHGKSKYDYTRQRTDAYGVDAPDFRESEEFAIYVDTVKAIIYAESEIPSRRIKAELGGLNNDHWTAEALDILCASEHVEMVGVQWIRYRKSEPTKRVVIAQPDGQKLSEYKAYQRQVNESYPAYASNF